MQLLTASKLSTVAMLAMAAVLVHSPVSGVPMEKPAATEAPIDPYTPLKPGVPSPKAYEDLLAITALRVPPSITPPPSRPTNSQGPLDMLSDELMLKITGNVNKDSMKSLAQTNKRNLGIALHQRSRQATELRDRLDATWEAYEKKVLAEGVKPHQSSQVLAAFPLWEETVKQVTGQQELKDCPYDLLPYTPDIRPQNKSPTEQELLVMDDYGIEFYTYVKHNVCRLAVNGAYPWLLRLIYKYDLYLEAAIFSVLGQMRLFTREEGLATDLDKLLKLFTSMLKADARKIYFAAEGLEPLLMASTPAIIPVSRYSLYDINEAALLLLAAAKQTEKSDPKNREDSESTVDSQLYIAGQSLVEVVKKGNLDEFLENIRPRLKLLHNAPELSYNLLHRLAKYFEDFDGSMNQAFDKLFDDPSSGFITDGPRIQIKEQFAGIQDRIKPLEILVKFLSKEQRIKFYNDTFRSERNSDYVIAAGMTRDGPEFMQYVFADIFGGPGTPIDPKAFVNKYGINAQGLSQLAMGCAIAFPPSNWQAFTELFVGKVQATQQLPMDASRRPSSGTTAQLVAKEIKARIEDIKEENTKHRKATPLDKDEAIQKDVKQVIQRLQDLANSLSQPPANTATPQ